MINQFDLAKYPCPMNLVMAKQHFFELKNGSSAIFILNTENKAGIENILAFLGQKDAKYTITTQDTSQQNFTYIAFTKPGKQINITAQTLASGKIAAKKLALKSTLQQNLKRRKGE